MAGSLLVRSALRAMHVIINLPCLSQLALSCSCSYCNLLRPGAYHELLPYLTLAEASRVVIFKALEIEFGHSAG
ncbi:hypothetical protein F5Y01DRAFT_293699 [Xylaria sp. FL0043]|nr:hypothetical protein F5Y01DRAFT_293699 [Xylaria sp. FL0043]